MANKDSPQPEYDTLLRLYGESMLRVEQLEAQVASQSEGPPQGDDAQARAILKLTERVEALQRQIARSAEAADVRTDAQPADDRKDEIAQMRSQITSLANQLDVARSEIKDYRARRRRRSRRSERLAWWQSVVRRLGISRPRGP